MDGQWLDAGRLQSIGSEGTRFQWQMSGCCISGRHLFGFGFRDIYIYTFCELRSFCMLHRVACHGWFACLNVCVASRCLEYFQANCFQMLSEIILSSVCYYPRLSRFCLRCVLLPQNHPDIGPLSFDVAFRRTRIAQATHSESMQHNASGNY